MSTDSERLARLRRFNSWVTREDTELAEETADVREELFEVAPSAETVQRAIDEESIILRRQRPVLTILNNEPQLVFVDPADSEIWKSRLTKARPLLDGAIRSVGRIELDGGRLDWVGTGWVVADNILVTNRHVANEFAMRKGAGFAFRIGADRPVSAGVNFLQEFDNPDTLVFKLVKPLYIEEDGGPDLAFFEIDITSGNSSLLKPIELAKTVVETENVATIGYPAYDSRIPETDLMEHIYGRMYNKKRLAPGGITRVEQMRLLHNCTTLGGNSGSVVFDLDSGQAAGLHFSGTFLATNYAVRSDVVKKVLDSIRSGRVRPQTPARRSPTRAAAPRVRFTESARHPGSASVTIPLTVTISLGSAGERMAAPSRYRLPPVPPRDDEADIQIEEEAAASDYRDREGYQANFLGGDRVVELPRVERDADDVLDFDVDGQSETRLRYEHFSVVMCRSRRMCFYTRGEY